jgi:mannose/fructose/N-acetylgalactosamine-specific phosphotransferase system component IID
VQSSWNYAGLQNLGFYFMTWPALARTTLPAPEVRRVALSRLRNFNTHPYFAGLVAAAVIRHERDGGSEESAEGLKRSLMSALGAIGDEFFWGVLRPLAALLALPAALAGALWAPLVMLAVFNIPHLWVRAWGISAALAGQGGVLAMLRRQPLTRSLPALGVATGLAAGFLLGALCVDSAWGLFPGHGFASAGVSAAAFLALLSLLKLGLAQGRLLALLCAAAALLGLAQVAGVVS